MFHRQVERTCFLDARKRLLHNSPRILRRFLLFESSACLQLEINSSFVLTTPVRWGKRRISGIFPRRAAISTIYKRRKSWGRKQPRRNHFTRIISVSNFSLVLQRNNFAQSCRTRCEKSKRIESPRMINVSEVSQMHSHDDQQWHNFSIRWRFTSISALFSVCLFLMREWSRAIEEEWVVLSFRDEDETAKHEKKLSFSFGFAFSLDTRKKEPTKKR